MAQRKFFSKDDSRSPLARVAGPAVAAAPAPAANPEVVRKPIPRRLADGLAAAKAIAAQLDAAPTGREPLGRDEYDESTPLELKKIRATRRRTPPTIQLDVTRPVLNRHEAAAYLGIGLSTLLAIAQVGRDADGKQLGHTRVGARLAFLREDLDRYVRAEAPRPGATVGWALNPKRQAARIAAAAKH